MIKEKIIILLSTYNAELYLREQLDSLFAQDYANINIVVRDDGSKDSTVKILEEYREKYDNFTFYAGENIGAKDSFFDLIEHVKGREFGFIAFCDQDDYWKKEKLSAATDAFAGDLPQLYCGKPQLADYELNPIKKEIKRNIRPAFSNALIENIVTGCTVVINRAMFDILVDYMPKYCIMHDWWMYIIASCFGRVIYDTDSYILYRQHGNNVMGIESSYASELSSRISKFRGRKSNISMQAEELVRLMEQKRNEWADKEEIVECYKKAKLLATYKENLKKRVMLAFGRQVYRQRRGDNIIFNILFLLGLR